MNYGEVLQKYLFRIARGELKEVESVIPLLSPSIFFMGVKKEVKQNELIKLTVLTVDRDGNHHIPVFLTKSHLLSVSNDYDIHPVEVRGDSLLNSMPKGYGLIIEPNTSLEVSFSPELLQNEVIVEEEHNTDEKINDLDQDKTYYTLDKEVLTDLEISLINILDDYPIISEAYLATIKSNDSDCLLGILVEGMEEDLRFNLYEKIAALSKRIFGYASGIEVIDDLYDIHSSSWDLFKRLLPFYIKPYELVSEIEVTELNLKKEKKVGKSSTNLEIEDLDSYYKSITESPKESTQQESTKEENSDSLSFSSLKNTGLRLLFGYNGKKH